MKLTNQTAFNKIYNYFIFKKNKQCINEYGACAYRAGKLKCAVGVLIPSKKYVVEMEDMKLETLIEEYFPVEWNKLNINLLADLQNTHDSRIDWSNGVLKKASLEELAKEYDLTIPKEK